MSETTLMFYRKYESSGFYFPKSLLTTYALALKTKPFVILSGISGTGKTKISQLFEIPTSLTQPSISLTETPKITLRVTESLERQNFTYNTIGEFLTPEELQEWNENIRKFSQENNNGNFSKTYVIEVKDGSESFKIGIYGQRASSPLLRVRFHSSRNDKDNESYDARNYLHATYNINDVLELKKIGDKKFEVESSNNDTVRSIQSNSELETLDRHCFIPVRSNWVDNTELLGYYNLIEKKYHVTKFLNFLLLARDYPDYPFFITLDEMNLSKVEHYFSDILSCTESRILTESGIIQEPLDLYTGSQYLETDSEDFETIPTSLEIPLNIFITGTVNIDESTFSFSNKVLDRANVIEFNDVYLDTKTTKEEGLFELEHFPNFNDYKIATREDYLSLPEYIKVYLIKINDILKVRNLHFGYRTANEIALYINNVKTCINEERATIIQALDHQLVQKVFPKLNGEYALLENILNNILCLLSEKNNIDEIKSEESKFPITIKKLLRMYDVLNRTGYANFIE